MANLVQHACPKCGKLKHRTAYRRKLWPDEIEARLDTPSALNTLEDMQRAGRWDVWVYERICRACHPRGAYRPSKATEQDITAAVEGGFIRAYTAEDHLRKLRIRRSASYVEGHAQRRRKEWLEELKPLRDEDVYMCSRRLHARRRLLETGEGQALVLWLNAYLDLLRRIRAAALLQARATHSRPSKVGGWPATLTDALQRDLASLRGIYDAHSLHPHFPRRPPLLLNRAREIGTAEGRP
jgi:hypothetical protein